MPSRRTSSIWYHFNEGNDKAECVYCKKLISTAGGSFGNLRRHLKKKHPTVPEERRRRSITPYGKRSESPFTPSVSSCSRSPSDTPSTSTQADAESLGEFYKTEGGPPVPEKMDESKEKLLDPLKPQLQPIPSKYDSTENYLPTTSQAAEGYSQIITIDPCTVRTVDISAGKESCSKGISSKLEANNSNRRIFKRKRTISDIYQNLSEFMANRTHNYEHLQKKNEVEMKILEAKLEREEHMKVKALLDTEMYSMKYEQEKELNRLKLEQEKELVHIKLELEKELGHLKLEQEKELGIIKLEFEKQMNSFKIQQENVKLMIEEEKLKIEVLKAEALQKN
ncbi:unnamed protein product [Nezara viridula]|uniref:BED-type domain-containing protein n=1 Tax=Nezara viridula TaxID=85310 RepID=A0A9P0HST5_NEZVI|nr:unnamed protein product [Nezara viridula]